jgi:hypothetical protein
MKMMKECLSITAILVLAMSAAAQKVTAPSVHFAGKHGQVEVGGRFVGFESHNSLPLPNRISFFYPVANSIDLSTDYWHRGLSRPLVIGLKVNDGPKRWMGLEPYEYELAPYTVSFEKKDSTCGIKVSYDFCLNEPAMVMRLGITNLSATNQHLEIFARLETSVRTCQSYTVKNRAWTTFDTVGTAIYACFDETDTDSAQVFVANVGEKPSSWTSSASEIGLPESDINWWMNHSSPLLETTISRTNPQRAVAAFLYEKDLSPHGTMTIIQLIGSCKQYEGKARVKYLVDNWQKEIDGYQLFVQQESKKSLLRCGDPVIDETVTWAKALLASNAHYLDGHILPMPCPAEYNFFFTHDVLLTDLAAVFFDVERVKKDLLYIVSKADDKYTIPHAYYWRDDGYKTEYCTPDNWNHLWFILVAGTYLRHTGDKATLEKILPYLQRSINQVLSNRQEDDLMYAYRPDWWDMGRSFGPRSYITILTIRALREMLFVASTLGNDTYDFQASELLARHMQQQLNANLWDDKLNYLINYNEGRAKDEHIYIGSLLAAHYDVIDIGRKRLLVETAKSRLLDENIGVRNVMPADFNELISYFKFNGNEAGEPYFYANGGVWAHGNAWYLLALISIGRNNEAFDLMKKLMTVRGVMNSPNGQPAMYEYRYANPASPDYGRIDKPCFLWAGGWYLNVLYHIFGVQENEWSLAFHPTLPDGVAKTDYDLTIRGKPVRIQIQGRGSAIERILFDGRPSATAVIPEGAARLENISIKLGAPQKPYLNSAQSALVSSHYDPMRKMLAMVFRAFPHHENSIEVISPFKPKNVSVDGKRSQSRISTLEKENYYQAALTCRHTAQIQQIVIQF